MSNQKPYFVDNVVSGETRLGLRDLNTEDLGMILDQVSRTGHVLRGVLAPYRALEEPPSSPRGPTSTSYAASTPCQDCYTAFRPTFAFPRGPFGRRSRGNNNVDDGPDLFDVRPLTFASLLTTVGGATFRHGDRVRHRQNGLTATVVGVAPKKRGERYGSPQPGPFALWIHVDGTLGAMVPCEHDIPFLECIGHQRIVSVPSGGVNAL